MSVISGVGAVAVESVTGESVDNTAIEIGNLKVSLGMAMSDLEERVDSLEGAVTLISENIGNIEQQTADIDLETPILVVEQKLDSIANSVNSSIGNLSADISSLESRVGNLESWTGDQRWVTIQAAASSVSSISKSISDISGSLNIAISERASLRSSLVNMTSRMSSLESSMAAINTEEESSAPVTIQAYDDSDIRGDISTINDKISIVSGDISRIDTLISDLDSRVDSLESGMTEISQTVGDISVSIVSDHNNITLQGSSLTNHEDRISNIESGMGAIPERTGLKVLDVAIGSGGNTLNEATGVGSTPVKFTMNYSGKNFTFLGNWNNDGGNKGSGIFTADDGAGDDRVFLIKKDGGGLSLDQIFPFEGDLGDLDPEQIQVVKVLFKAMLENDTKMDSEQVIDIGIAACTRNTSWSVRTWRGLTQAFSSDIEKYLADGKDYRAILPELCGIDYTNEDVGAIGGIDTGGDIVLDKYSVVEENPEEPDYIEYEVPISIYNGKTLSEVVKYRGRYLDGIYWLHPPFTDILNSNLEVPNGGVLGSNGRYTMPEGNRRFYYKFLRYQLPAILRRIKEGYGISWNELNKGPNYMVVSDKSGSLNYGYAPEGFRVIPILISNEPRASAMISKRIDKDGVYRKIDAENIAARTLSYGTGKKTGFMGEATVIEIPVANIQYTQNVENDLDGMREAAATSKFLDRTLCHEMVHAMMFSNIRYLGVKRDDGKQIQLESLCGISVLPSLAFTEGIAELICGADDTRLNANAAVVDKNFSSKYTGVVYSMEQYLRQQLTGKGPVLQYSAGYCALRYFLKQCVAHKKGRK